MPSSRKRRMAACRKYLTVLDTVVIQLTLPRSSLRKRSLHLTKNITSSVGGYLPNTITEMWEPSRDFAFLRLPTSGTKTVVALSGYVQKLMIFLCPITWRFVGLYHRLWFYHPTATSTRIVSIWRMAGNAHCSSNTSTFFALFQKLWLTVCDFLQPSGLQ